MKNIVLLMILPLLFSCGNPYDGETIVNLNLKIVDANSQPIPNVKANIGAGNNAFEVYDYEIYKKTSNFDGIINFDMFMPVNPATLYIDNSITYLPVTISGLSDSTFSSLNWDIGTIMLFKQEEIIPFNITINQITATKTITNIEIVGDHYQNEIKLGSEIYESNELQTYFLLKKNQNFILKYELVNSITNLTETIEENLSISDTEYNYTLTF
ncbi:hypothetical protein [Flavobacterium sp.]|uniref:hypothetical protein n=1 Tax=Flavobacterium sp. TaxID=239 RepID=UPI0026282344|nr:hypothetical protein [Flavobacterium sp.]